MILYKIIQLSLRQYDHHQNNTIVVQTVRLLTKQYDYFQKIQFHPNKTIVTASSDDHYKTIRL